MAIQRKTMKAVKMVTHGVISVRRVPVPQCGPTQILVRTKAIAMNPTDWKHCELFPTEDSTVGCDGAGEIVEVGSQVTKWKVGDRVAAMTHGSSHLDQESGCFGDYFRAYAHLAIKLPDHVSYEEAATLPVVINTTGQGLYMEMGLPLPNEPTENPIPVLISGGATGVGLMAVQCAKLSGLKVIATCSPKNFDLVKSLGADVTIDYNDPEVVRKIKEASDNNLKYAMDCWSETSTLQMCNDSFGPNGGNLDYLVVAADISFLRKDIKPSTHLAYSATGQDFMFVQGMWKIPSHHPLFAEKFVGIMTQLLAEKKIRPLPIQKIEGGLKAVHEALFNVLKPGVSGEKVVIKIED